MVNYNSIEEIIAAGVDNAECLVNNVAYDDNNYTAVGVDWFTFKNVVCNNIIFSGNSWAGFGSATEHLRIDRRDTKMWYLYREEGILYNYYKFLKFRWSGFSVYSQTAQNYKLTYDVILFDTGDIMLNMVDIPTTNNDGIYSLVANTTYTYTTTAAAPAETFYIQPDGAYILENAVINLIAPYDRKYLIKEDEYIYNIVENELNVVATDINYISNDATQWAQGTYNGNVNAFKAASNRIRYTNNEPIEGEKLVKVTGTTENLLQICAYCIASDGLILSETGWKSLPFEFTTKANTVQLAYIARFSNNAAITPATGITENTNISAKLNLDLAGIFSEYGNDTPPPQEALLTLAKPKILYWQDSDDELPELTAEVKAMPPGQQIITNDIDISDASITGIEKVTTEYTGAPLFACSFDSGESWEMWNGTTWAVLSEELTGMSAETLESITTETWNAATTGLNSFLIRIAINTLEDTITNVIVDFTN